MGGQPGRLRDARSHLSQTKDIDFMICISVQAPQEDDELAFREIFKRSVMESPRRRILS